MYSYMASFMFQLCAFVLRNVFCWLVLYLCNASSLSPVYLQGGDDSSNSDRLRKLAAFQRKALEHAFSCKSLSSYLMHFY